MVLKTQTFGFGSGTALGGVVVFIGILEKIAFEKPVFE
jgi:hypothetical protein